MTKSHFFLSLNTTNIQTHFSVISISSAPISSWLTVFSVYLNQQWNRWQALCAGITALINWHWECQRSGREMDSSWIQRLTGAGVHLFTTSSWVQRQEEQSSKQEWYESINETHLHLVILIYTWSLVTMPEFSMKRKFTFFKFHWT